jgi:hypothetical protein
VKLADVLEVEPWSKRDVARYAKLAPGGPPVLLVQDERGYVVWDGAHRVAAARLRGDRLLDAFVGRDEVPVKRNHLLSKPPRAVHRLQNTRSFQRLMGRAPQQADYDGVHTTGSELIAAAYAMSAWNQHYREGYPVLVTLDVSGLKALPDVDAMLRGAEQVDALLNHYRGLVGDGMGFWDLMDDEDYSEASAQVGDEPAAFIFEDMGNHMLQAIDAYASAEGLDAEEIFAEVLQTEELPPGVLTRMVDQQRYLNDFDIDRVVQIEAIKPWWDRVLLSWDDEDFKQIAARGWEVFTMDEWPFGRFDTKTVWKATDASKREKTEYHGTTSLVIELAFPGLIPAKSPFPVEDE